MCPLWQTGLAGLNVNGGGGILKGVVSGGICLSILDTTVVGFLESGCLT